MKLGPRENKKVVGERPKFFYRGPLHSLYGVPTGQALKSNVYTKKLSRVLIVFINLVVFSNTIMHKNALNLVMNIQ
jgi:hypothetical protein